MKWRRLAALVMAVLVHGLFVAAVASMALALLTGLQLGLGPWRGLTGWVVNALLVLQFPVLHSALLTNRGRQWLVRLSPVGHGRKLATSTYVLIGTLQLLLVFWGWCPSETVWHRAAGPLGIAQYALFVGAWLFLIVALTNAGLALQTGAAGWLALWRDRPVDFGSMPTHGLFARCRQPIYLGFALVLWTAPTWSPDWLVLMVVWSAYCGLGPLHKESRWEVIFGARFRDYRRTVPYFLPRTLR